MGEQSPLEAQWVPDPVEPGDEGPCLRCGASPARTNQYMYVMSFLLFTRHATYEARLCRGCATRIGFTELGKSALLGWWGIPWGLLTFGAIFKNVRSLFRWSTLPKAAVPLLGLLAFAAPVGVAAWLMQDQLRTEEAKKTGDWGSEEVVKLIEQGHEQSDQGKPAEALALYLKAYEQVPNSSNLNASLATTYVNLGELDKALRHAARAEELAPNRLSHAALHGWLLQRTGDTEAARLKAKAIAGREPQEPMDAEWMADLYFELEDWPALEAAARTAVQKFPDAPYFPPQQLLALLGRDDLAGYAAAREALKDKLDPANESADLAFTIHALRTAPDPPMEQVFARWTGKGYSEVAMRQLVTATERAGHLEAARAKVRSWLRAKETPGDAWMQAWQWLPEPVLNADLDAYLAVRHEPAPTFVRINSLDPLRDGPRRRALAAAARDAEHPLASTLDAIYIYEARRGETAAAWQADMRQHLAAHPDHASCRLALANDVLDDDPAAALAMLEEIAKGAPAELTASIGLARAEVLTAEGKSVLAAQAMAAAEEVVRERSRRRHAGGDDAHRARAGRRRWRRRAPARRRYRRRQRRGTRRGVGAAVEQSARGAPTDHLSGRRRRLARRRQRRRAARQPLALDTSLVDARRQDRRRDGGAGGGAGGVADARLGHPAARRGPPRRRRRRGDRRGGRRSVALRLGDARRPGRPRAASEDGGAREQLIHARRNQRRTRGGGSGRRVEEAFELVERGAQPPERVVRDAIVVPIAA